MPESERLYALAADRFSAALRFAPGDPHILARYADALCSYLLFDGGGGGASGGSGVGSGPGQAARRVGEAIARRSRASRPTACRAGWPSYCGGSRPTTRSRRCDALDAVLRLDPGFFGLVAHPP